MGSMSQGPHWYNLFTGLAGIVRASALDQAQLCCYVNDWSLLSVYNKLTLGVSVGVSISGEVAPGKVEILPPPCTMIVPWHLA